MPTWNLKVYPIEHDRVYNQFGSAMRKERVAIKREDKNTQYLCITNGVHPIAVVGWQELANEHIRLKTDYIYPNFRGKKLYSYLFNRRFFLILDQYKPKTLSAYCTPMSLPKYLKMGFIKQSTNKHGITYVKQQLR